jgi:large subunit ribosomal protein L15
LYALQKPDGSTKSRKRVGRGPGSGRGKTSGRGHKGQMARAGARHRAWNEGGQMPLVRRVPKRGFRALHHRQYQLVKVADLARKFTAGGEISLDQLREEGLIKSVKRPVKILSDGEIQVGLNLQVHAASRKAIEKLTAAGGKVELLKC